MHDIHALGFVARTACMICMHCALKLKQHDMHVLRLVAKTAQLKVKNWETTLRFFLKINKFKINGRSCFEMSNCLCLLAQIRFF
jgi:hypothetical protein